MTRQTDTSSELRAPLSRERILDTAMSIADAEGIAALTMRRLGQELGVEAMSLYNHVANKDDILGGMLEIAMGEIALPSYDGDWKVEIRASAISAHDVLLRHPWASNLMLSATRMSVARLQWMDAVLGALRRHGFSAELTHHVYHALDSHIVGFALWLASLPALGEDLVALAERALPEIPAATYPYLVEHIDYHLHDTGEGEREFVFGLNLILDGVERIRDAG